MDGLYVLRDGEKLDINVVLNFKFNGNIYCVYSIVNRDNTNKCDIYCGKIVENVLRNITEETEKNAVNKIVKDLFNSVQLEDDYNDMETVEIIKDGKKVTAEVLDVIELNDEEYFLLAVDNGSMSDIFATKVVHVGNEVKYISLTSDEQELVLDTLDDILD